MMTNDDLLAREADHRIANSLQLVAGLLQSQARGNRDPNVVRELMAASGRISYVFRAHQQLYRNPGDDLVAVRPYLETLCKDIADGAGSSDSLVIASDDLWIDPARAVDVGLVVTELVLNALKHAGGGAIEVRGCVVGDTFSLTVSDCGPGLPPDFLGQISSSGLGLRLVRRLSADLGAELAALPEATGSTVHLSIPLLHLRRPTNAC